MLIPSELLSRSDKVLFIAHLALGDYTYLQNDFRALSQAYPHLKIHVWVDELRRTSRASAWPALSRYALYDWLAACPFIAKVYNQTYSPALYRQSLHEAQAEHYPLVISLGLLRRQKYARLARRISRDGFVAGHTKRVRPLDVFTHMAYANLDVKIPAYDVSINNVQHISDIYAEWFSMLFGIEIPPADRFPFVDTPPTWKHQALRQVAEWGFSDRRIIFLNSFSKGEERNWPLESIVELVIAMRRHERWRDSAFVVNAVPEEMGRLQTILSRYSLDDVRVFSAIENFFELPALLSLCDLVISVETATMHLANAVHVPVVALVRQRNPEWMPIDRGNSTVIAVAGPEDWVETIPVEQVMSTLRALPEKSCPN